MAASKPLERQVGPGTAISETLGRPVGPGTAALGTFERPVGLGLAEPGLGRFWCTCRKGSWTALGQKEFFRALVDPRPWTETFGYIKGIIGRPKGRPIGWPVGT